MDKIRIGHLTTSYHTALVIMGTGWVEKKIGIKPEWRLFPTGPEMIKAFSRNELDIGFVGLPPAMIGIEKGIPIKCIAGGHMEGTIMTAKNLNSYQKTGSVAKTLEQLKGKIIGTPSKGSIHDVIMRTLLEQSGLSQTVSVKNFDWADMILDAMENGEVQAAVGTPPLAVLASKFLGAEIILPPHVVWPHNPSYGIVTTETMINNSAEILKEFLILHEKASNLIRNEPHKSAKIVADTVRLMNEEFVFEVYKVSPKYCASLSPEYLQSAMAFVPVLQRMHYINEIVTEQQVFHKELIERVHKEHPHYNYPLMLA